MANGRTGHQKLGTEGANAWSSEKHSSAYRIFRQLNPVVEQLGCQSNQKPIQVEPILPPFVTKNRSPKSPSRVSRTPKRAAPKNGTPQFCAPRLFLADFSVGNNLVRVLGMNDFGDSLKGSQAGDGGPWFVNLGMPSKEANSGICFPGS